MRDVDVRLVPFGAAPDAHSRRLVLDVAVDQRVAAVPDDAQEERYLEQLVRDEFLEPDHLERDLHARGQEQGVIEI